jgi:hypothetical protein
VAGIADAADATTSGSQSILLLADRADLAQALADAMREQGIDLPLYCDATEALRREYGVAVKTTYFRLDSGGMVTDFGVPRATQAGFLEAITNHQTQSRSPLSGKEVKSDD